jgi:hypothetical protein
MPDDVPPPEAFAFGAVEPEVFAPARLVLSQMRWRELEPNLAPSPLRRLLPRTPTPEQEFWRVWLPRVLRRGVATAAVVLHVEPLVVGAYSPVFDTCALLGFPLWLAMGSPALSFGNRLVTVLAYLPGEGMAADLHPGDDAEEVVTDETLPGHFANMLPVIADFVCDPASGTLRQARGGVPEWQWVRAEQRGRDELWLSRGALRDGRPSRAAAPAGDDAASYPIRELLPRARQLR